MQRSMNDEGVEDYDRNGAFLLFRTRPEESEIFRQVTPLSFSARVKSRLGPPDGGARFAVVGVTDVSTVTAMSEIPRRDEMTPLVARCNCYFQFS